MSDSADDSLARRLRGFGPIGILAIAGFVFGGIFASTGRPFLLMVAHAAFDLTAVAIIYFDLETAVARSVFG